MPSPISQLKALAKRSPRIVAIHEKLMWRLHILEDWWGTRVWRNTKAVRVPFGFNLVSGIHPAYAQMRAGTFEPDETHAILKLLPWTDVFVDVGANLGYFTCLALQQGKWVIAVEPQPLNLRVLTENLHINGWTKSAEVFPLALGERPGVLTLYGASGPSASLVRNWAGYSPRYQQTVPISTLDIICGDRFHGKKLFVKIDVEGAELGVLRGALRTLTQDPRPMWLLEVCLHEFHPSGANPDFGAVFSLFFEHGYRAWALLPTSREVSKEDVEKWAKDGRSQLPTFNYLFLSPDDARLLQTP